MYVPPFCSMRQYAHLTPQPYTGDIQTVHDLVRVPLSLIKHTFFYIFLLETRAHQYPGFRARTEKFKFESNLELASANKLATTNGGKWRYTHF
jgi:hypothetical protein